MKNEDSVVSIDTELSRTKLLIDNVADLLSKLQDKLEPFIITENIGDVKESSNKQKSSNSSPVRELLSNNNDKLIDIISNVESIIKKLDI